LSMRACCCPPRPWVHNGIAPNAFLVTLDVR
jgi:hypothetical protein